MATPVDKDISGWFVQSSSPIRDHANMSSARGGSLSFPLPSANFMEARMPMTVVYPRPDGETQTHARHRLMHTEMVYEIPIGVQGGAWPFQYSIITAPSGSTLGIYYGDTDYGVLKVPAQASGAHTITVRVTDQELNTIDITWEATVDDTAFTFIEDGYAGTQNGTIDEPLEDFADYYLGDGEDDTYANQVLVFRAGNYSVVGDSLNNYNVEMNSGIKSPTMIGFSGEAPVLDFSLAKIFTRDGTNQYDITVIGLRCENARDDIDNSHFFWLNNNPKNVCFYGNYFYEMTRGLVGNDNACVIFSGHIGSEKPYFLFKQNTFEEINTVGGGNGALIDLYDCSYVLFEENTVLNSTPDSGIWMKGTTRFVSIRANDAYDNCTVTITIGYGTESTSLCHDHEVCWNRIRVPIGETETGPFQWARSEAYEFQHYNNYIYRNSFINNGVNLRFVGAENYEVDSNVLVADSVWPANIMTVTYANIEVNETGNVTTDQTGALIGQARIDYLGTKGHEING